MEVGGYDYQCSALRKRRLERRPLNRPPPEIGDAYPPEVSDGLAPRESSALGRKAECVLSSDGKLRIPQDFTKGKTTASRPENNLQ